MSDLENLRNTIETLYELSEFGNYYYEIKNKQKATELKDYIIALNAGITNVTADMFKQCAFPCAIEMILLKGFSCYFHSGESYSPMLECEFQTDNYYSATFSHITECYEKNNTCVYFTLTLQYNYASNGQPESYTVTYTEHKTCAPFSDVIETKTNTITTITELKNWINEQI